jgi:hypothetical protein
MTDIVKRLPVELSNLIYSFVGKHPVAEIIEEHFDEEEEMVCNRCDHEKLMTTKDYIQYDGMCERCYILENPQLDTGIGRNCDTCNHELRMYRWCKVYGNSGGEYCTDCFNQQEEEE